MHDVIIYNLKHLYTPFENPPVRGLALSNVKIIDDAYIIIRNGKIEAFGSGDCSLYTSDQTLLINAKGKIGLPGFIDAHTHLVHAGSREDEFALLQQGTSYLDILKSGGGILSTVQKTRLANENALYHQAKASLNQMMLHGVTTVEAKSGYGLRLEDELKQLRVARKLHHTHPVHLVSTYMGAHAIPKEFENNKKGYIEQMKSDLDVIKNQKLAEIVDVFCEKGVFDLEDTRSIFTYAQDLGFKCRMHADEIEPMGGAQLGVEMNAISVDHLMATSEAGMMRLGGSQTIATLLPGTSFYLHKPYANARQMIHHDVAISIASDYNPGSCPTENFLFIMQLAAHHLKMTSNEILNAVTINPAKILGLDQSKGSIAIGKDADIILLDAPNLDYVLYHFGINHVTDVLIKGAWVVQNKQIKGEAYESN